MQKPDCFQQVILLLQNFWSDKGCVVLQPYDLEVGAGTFHPATTLRSLGSDHWSAAYVQPCRRPSDGRLETVQIDCSTIISFKLL